MPMPNKERQRLYRCKLKEDPERYEQYKRKDKNRKQAGRAKLCERSREFLKMKNRVYKRLQRQKNAQSNNSVNTGIIQPETETSSSIFRSRQSLGKAKKKLRKSLPLSPRKKRALIHAIAQEEGFILEEDSSKNQGLLDTNITKMHMDTKYSKVVDFFNEDHISSQTPGVKDCIILRLSNGSKEYVQKRYMLYTLKEAYGLFCLENVDVNVSFSKFAELRPPHVLLQKDMPHNMCLCKIHENVRLLLQGLSKVIPFETQLRSFISKIVCDQDNEGCMFKRCGQCPGFHQVVSNVNDAMKAQPCLWSQWITGNGDVNRVSTEGTVQDCLDELEHKLPEFLEHTFIKRVQTTKFCDLKAHVIDDMTQIVVQVDFAENYTCARQNEIQAAHWGHNQITVFSAVVWHNKEGQLSTKSYAIVTDHLSHDKYSVHTFLDLILIDLEKEIKLKTVHIFSDGATSQFKQRFNLCNITHREGIQITWHFFASYHGKGAVDGIGGKVKRIAKLAALSGKEIQNAQEFYDAVSHKDTCIKLIHVS